MSAHTPGPWMFYEDNNYGGTVELGDSGATVTVDRADRFTSDLVISRDEMRANGRLIAASPAMLAALKRVGCQDHGSCGAGEPDGLCFVCAAIARAEGKP